jgi:hypothetical protein
LAFNRFLLTLMQGIGAQPEDTSIFLQKITLTLN